MLVFRIRAMLAITTIIFTPSFLIWEKFALRQCANVCVIVYISDFEKCAANLRVECDRDSHGRRDATVRIGSYDLFVKTANPQGIIRSISSDRHPTGTKGIELYVVQPLTERICKICPQIYIWLILITSQFFSHLRNISKEWYYPLIILM